MPVILATQEAEIRRIAVQGQPEIHNIKRVGWVAQVVACLLSKCEVLSSKPTTTKEKEGGRRSEAERAWETLSCCSEEGERGHESRDSGF
jgi:hypothetical protein